jgi:hypothetical protein
MKNDSVPDEKVMQACRAKKLLDEGGRRASTGARSRSPCGTGTCKLLVVYAKFNRVRTSIEC